MIKKVLHFTLIIFLGICSYPLFDGWISAPYDQLSLFAFLIWMVPLFLRRKWVDGAMEESLQYMYMSFALLIYILGVISSLNALKYIALAFTLSLISHRYLVIFVMMITSVSWMPLFGWFLKDFSVPIVNGLRLLLSSLGTVFLSLLLTKEEK